jgi:hypothetical protein
MDVTPRVSPQGLVVLLHRTPYADSEEAMFTKRAPSTARSSLRQHYRLSGAASALLLTAALLVPTGLLAAGDGSSVSTFAPVADSWISSRNPDTNYGSNSTIRTDGSPLSSAYLKFDLSSLSGTVTKAVLNVYAGSGSSLGVSIHGVADNT